ncbi:hypothetical protein EO95_06655 [Methanosarcina sp. 1.H.T.1A.1]|uniref:DUF2769 domain-containing protein n=1 Tax=Methanosarcina sp. 1.H.T.1A.1 TaxID=1483602 RepID=UPI000621B3E6|nr:DUF2769 domain-containing protein [Methanosarcina sp. 1.H.T.1A.1]KKH97031.1 hypothetical protein EO95_06655 [Methanosarcina sp. 1.H.T.1A.1]
MEEATHIPSIAEQEQMVTLMCICPDCPSWIECGEKGGFCFETIEKSRCINEEKGCICPSCPVANSMGLEYMYYCTRGSEKEHNKNFRSGT